MASPSEVPEDPWEQYFPVETSVAVVTPAGIEMAWAVGLFEGEGSFVKRKNPNGRHAFSMVMSMCDEETLRRFHRVVGVGRVGGPYLPKQKHHSPFWSWSANGQEGKDLARSFRPLLSRRRIEKLDHVLMETTHPPVKVLRDEKNGQFVRWEIV